MTVCELEDCGRKRHRRTYCRPHYERLMKYGQFTSPVREPIDRTCAAPDCTRVRNNEAYCKTHYVRLRDTGSFEPRPKDATLWESVDVTGFCWLWNKKLNKDGYGTCSYEGSAWRAHRLTYTLLVGPIPKGLVIDHLCRVRHCVNPDHLEPVTHEENHARAFTLSKRENCPQGHLYDADNTRINRKGARYCGECMRLRGRVKLDARYAAEGRVPEVYGEGRTHCRNGHEYATDGVRILRRATGTSKLCTTCNKVSQKRYEDKKKQESLG